MSDFLRHNRPCSFNKTRQICNYVREKPLNFMQTKDFEAIYFFFVFVCHEFEFFEYFKSDS